MFVLKLLALITDNGTHDTRMCGETPSFIYIAQIHTCMFKLRSCVVLFSSSKCILTINLWFYVKHNMHTKAILLINLVLEVTK